MRSEIIVALPSAITPAWFERISDPLSIAWQELTAYPVVGSISIALLAYLLARVFVDVVLRTLEKLTAKTSTGFDDALIQHLRRPIFLSIFFSGLSLATKSLDLPPQFENGTVKILYTILVLVWMTAGFPIIHLFLDALGSDDSRFKVIEERTVPLFDNTSKIVLIGFCSYFLLVIWDINATAWLASAGVVGIAVGFAAKDTLANLFAGFFIVADAPYKIGDYINLEGGERGKVTNVGIRSTRLLTRDDIEITLPNALIANGKIINESGGRWQKARIRIKVGVAYGSDVDRVCSMLTRLALDHAQICEDPEPRVRMRGFGDSSLDFELLCWIDHPELRGKLSHELYMVVYKTFAREGIEIPYPKRDVYVRNMQD